jgi:predicted transcriptional regulator of viral defense system
MDRILKYNQQYEYFRIFAQKSKKRIMKDYLHKLHKMKLFSLQDVSRMTNNVNTAKSLLAAGIKNKTICRVKMNLYAVTDLATLRCAANKYEIASHISDNGYVAYHSAMEYHGHGHQLFNEVSVITPYAFRAFEFEGLTYIRRQPTISEGVMTPLMNSMVRVTDLERTIVDCIDRMKYAGGLEELLNNLSSIAYVDESRLVHYLSAYQKASLYQKTGFLLSLFKTQLRLSPSFFRQCKSHIGKSTRYLNDPAENTIYDADWHLCVPKDLTNLMGRGGLYV